MNIIRSLHFVEMILRVGKYFISTPKILLLFALQKLLGFDTIDEAEVVGFSGDNEFCKMAWRQSNELLENIDHPLLADCGLDLSSELGIVDVDEGVCYRATFIVDPDNIIQHVSVNALDTGRNHEEV